MGNVINKKEHDVYGALIREITLTWNDDNRLTEVKDGANQTIATYTYNGLGQRVKKVAGSNITFFLYDLQGNIISEIRDGSYDDYLYVANQRIAKITNILGTEAIYYYHNDHLGTPLVMTNSSGAVVWKARYKTFGEAQVDSSSTITNNFRFPGQYYDEESGLHYNYHRYYDPGTGRYVTADPIGIMKGKNHLFAYVKNNPLHQIDPYGLFCNACSDCQSGAYSFSGVEYGGFLIVAGVSVKHLVFKCVGGNDAFKVTYQCVNFGGGLGGGISTPGGIASGCNKNEVISNIGGFSVFVNAFPPVVTAPGFGVGGGAGFGPVSGDSPYPIPGGSVDPGYGLEMSAGGSYCWKVD